MAFKKVVIVERTIWVSECTCGDRVERTENTARERYCANCDKWIPFTKVTYSGPDIPQSTSRS